MGDSNRCVVAVFVSLLALVMMSSLGGAGSSLEDDFIYKDVSQNSAESDWYGWTATRVKSVDQYLPNKYQTDIRKFRHYHGDKNGWGWGWGWKPVKKRKKKLKKALKKLEKKREKYYKKKQKAGDYSDLHHSKKSYLKAHGWHHHGDGWHSGHYGWNDPWSNDPWF